MRTATIACAALALCATTAAAHPQRDPGAPPAATVAAAQAESRTRAASVGPVLADEAERLLRASFDAADVAHRGTLSREEASAGGFGWIAQRFDAIDTRQAGRVSFDDVRRYLKLRDAGDTRK
ncbi:MAG: hypothetical protein ABJD97_07230 [Betaproteobacteria bacterium]